VWAPGGRPRIAFGFTIRGGKIVEIELWSQTPHAFASSTWRPSTTDFQVR
jgi:hypothetical protein